MDTRVCLLVPGGILLSKAKKICMSHQNTPRGTQVCPAGPELMADPGPIQSGVVSVVLVLWSNPGLVHASQVLTMETSHPKVLVLSLQCVCICVQCVKGRAHMVLQL